LRCNSNSLANAVYDILVEVIVAYSTILRASSNYRYLRKGRTMSVKNIKYQGAVLEKVVKSNVN